MPSIQKWGNSLAIRIPQALAGQLEVTEGASVELRVRDGELIVQVSRCAAG